MARHLIIGDGTTRSTANPVEDGAISIQKMSSSGPTELVAGDTISTAPQIRVIMGGSDGKNVVTPWIYGKDVIDWSGKSYVASVAQTTTLLPVATAAATVGGKELDIKFVYLNGKGGEERFSFATTIVASSVIADSGAAIIAAFNALTNVPEWLNPTATLSTATVTFTGAKRGDATQSGGTWDYESAVFTTHIASNPVTTQTYTIVNDLVDAIPGYGDGFAVKALEESLMGISHGYYNRVQLPKAPTTETATGSIYDMYHIASTKDGSSSSQIHGVDNLIEINIASIAGHATTGAPHAAGQVIEDKLNPWMNSAGFVTLNL
tara:strand:+ start:122 stop:1084 length:963 start_codon:yes stop_codon:yes gene_type:complete